MKEKLLKVNQQGSYASFSSEQTIENFTQLSAFLAANYNDLPEIEYFELIELQFKLALLVGNDEVAKTCLDRLIDKFGHLDTPRITVLKADYMLANSEDFKQVIEYLDKKLAESDDLLVLKKKTALTKHVATTEEYIDNLKHYLDINPTDVETWYELSEVYYSVKHFDKAIFCLEEVLVVIPNAYNVFSRIGELNYLLFKQAAKKDAETLVKSVKNFSRSVELCGNHVEGWSGLCVVLQELLALDKLKSKSQYEELLSVSKSQLQTVIDEKRCSEVNLARGKEILQSIK